MKANELMHNDWYSGLNGSNERDNFQFDIYDLDFWGDCEPQPIPLTKEILKENGFIHKDTMEEWWHEEYDPTWGMRMSDFELTDEFKFGRAKINYVHQLQHALRLCGLNELADNFKLK